MAKRKKTMSTPLTFGELEVGTKFIDFPIDGDDKGHGGYRGGSWLLMKVAPMGEVGGICAGLAANVIRVKDGAALNFSDHAKVIAVY